ncbi:tol-pal system protein YbgF [Catenovulum sediminis]|uniref:Cell division coordinator CpoB n=1 Tax=Catenovulum sediminis TaxID=1740262 RepID=A0ABV1RNB2_9ALTE|nr:tol-pal system protein YbgF [Catenovulum sediminis]
MMAKLSKLVAFSLGVASLACTPFVYAERNMSLNERIDMLERAIDARSRSQVEMAQQVDSLQFELSELRGISEEHNHKLSQILERQRELYQELDKITQLTQQMSDLTAQSKASGASSSLLNANTGLTASNSSSSSSVQAYTDNLDENQAYDRAVNLVLKDKRYEQAIPEFEKFIQQFPNSVYQPNAHYWLGQLFFTKGELKAAAKSFNQVVENYPESNKRPDAIFKSGMVAQKLGQVSLAKEKYQQVLREYPDSTSAKLANSRLAEL